MNDVTQVMNMDFGQLFLHVLTIIAAILFVVTLLEKFFILIGRPIKWIKKNDTDHQLISDAISTIKSMQETHAADKKEVNDKNDKLEKALTDFMTEVRNDIKTFTDNRIHDREQSFEIQKQLTDSIQTVVDNNQIRDAQINALMCGSKELLGNTIDERYEKYINLGGIPQNEVDEFDSIYDAYTGLNGNHGRKTKYEYVKEHLPVIPVKTELVFYKHE